MKLVYDIILGRLIEGESYTSPVTRLDAVRGDGEYIALALVQNGVLWQAPGGTELLFTAKRVLGGDVLAAAETWVYDASTGLYEAAIDWATGDLDALLLIGETPENDCVKLIGEFAMQRPSLGGWRRSQSVDLHLHNGVWQGDEDLPDGAVASLLRPSVLSITSNVVNNNATANTMADVTGLQFPVTAGKNYGFKFVIPYTAAATTTGSRWSITGPASPTALSARSTYPLTATTETTNYLSSYDLPAAANASSLTAGNVAIIEGHIKPSASGDVKARFASEVSGSAITALAGAHVMFWEMP